ncbi:MAG: PHP domain-containing protein [Gemmatimonadales bacterium]|nr:MAG: PHP domain-containing protein [Gemmatimonadales bacterium]
MRISAPPTPGWIWKRLNPRWCPAAPGTPWPDARSFAVNLDLHLHSTASDGSLPPEAVVHAAVAGHLDVIALTDHDTVAGIEAALEAAQGHPIHVIPALEVSSTWDEREIHILGYFVDPSEGRLRAHDGRARERRAQRLEEMVGRLRSQGLDVRFDDVVTAAGEGVASMGRPHLARALVDRGIVASIPEAFDRYIGNDHAAYIPTRLQDPESAIAMIHGAGGIAVWAHPPMWMLHDLLPELVKVGLDGVEVYRPRNHSDRVLELERAARGAGLAILTGGSDWHGPDDGELGTFVVDSRQVSAFLERGGM